MLSKAAIDSSPLIVLIKSDLEHILPDIFKEIFIVDSVWNEVLAGPEDDPARLKLPSIDWLTRVKADDLLPNIAEYGLGQGEMETISFTAEIPNTAALLDDSAGRRCAKSIGIPFLGTGRLIVEAGRRGLIHSASDALVDVRNAGLWIGDEVIDLLLKKADVTD